MKKPSSLLAGVLLLVGAAAANGSETPLKVQAREFDADVPKTILELQQFRRSTSIRIRSNAGREGVATLINLNPTVNSWFVLKVAWRNGSVELAYHLENSRPAQKLFLDESYPAGIVIATGNDRYRCDLFAADALGQAKASQLVFSPLCEGRVYLRNTAAGHRTNLEAATEFLRERVWGGEKIVAFGHILMGDMHRETGQIEPGAALPAARSGDLPSPARIDPKYRDRRLTSANLGIVLDESATGGMTPGAWYAASGNPGVFVSILQPNLIDGAILQSYKAVVNTLDSADAAALCYLVAFDLDRFELGFALGTEHPRVGWSDRVPDRMKDSSLPGPDGIRSVAPLVPTGLLTPDQARRTASVFIGGFKRAHGAFRYGELASKNHGSHYGFMENGAIFSKLQPGLATLYVLSDNSIGMKTWTEEDNRLVERIKHARQNGVPIIERNEVAKTAVPGALVGRWGPGNWSGSEDARLRTMRSGAALQTSRGKRFLIYAVFSDATPSAMARILQAYECDYAMLLDMNALEHTYMAVYRRSGSQIFVDHLLKGMSVLEKSASGEIVPRFLGYADNRDFFYVMRRDGKEGKR